MLLFSTQEFFRLHLAHLTPERLVQARELALAHPGKCPLFLCLRRPNGGVIFVETHERYHVCPSMELQKAADDLFGEETYYAKADTSTPERPQRRWEKSSEPAMPTK